MKRILPLLILVITVLLAGCSLTDGKRLTGDAANNIFAAMEVKEGDVIAGMKITSLDVTELDEYGTIGRVKFSGQTTISGTFEVFKDDMFLDDGVRFIVAEESLKSIPKMANDERAVWFMFENQVEAEKYFGSEIKTGQATITIDNYEIWYEPSEVYNRATLLKAEITD